MIKKDGFVSNESNEDFLRTLINESVDGIMVIDTEGVVRFANPAAKDLFEGLVDELVGYHFGMVANQENVEIIISHNGQQRTVEVRATDITWQGQTAQLATLRDITERVRIEEELRERERLLQATNKMARVGGWALDIDAGEVWWSEVTREIHAVPEDYQPLLDDALKFYPQPGREKLAKAIAHTRETGEPYDLELPFVTFEGAHLWTRALGEAEIRDDETVELRGTFQDITERKEAELALKKSERKYRLLFDNAINGFALTEVQKQDDSIQGFVFVDVNDAFEEMIGMEKEEVIGKSAMNIFPGVEETLLGKKFFEIAETREAFRFEYYSEMLEKYFLMSVYSPLEGQVATIFNDITEQKKAEEELRQSEKKYRLLFQNDINSFALMEVVTGVSGDIKNFILREVNQAFEETLNLNREDVIGKSAAEVFPGLEETDLRKIVGEVFLSGESKRFEYYSITYEKFFHFSAYQPLPGQVAVIFNDITESKQAEEALRKSEEKYRTLYETMTLGALHVNRDLEIHTVNPAAEEILGRDAEEILGRQYTDPIWDPIDLDGEPLPDEERPSVKGLQTGERVENFVYGIYNPEKGKHIWINVSVVPQFHEGEEEPYRAFSTFSDITERIEAGRELRQSEEKFRTLYESMAQGVVYVDRQGKYTSGNPTAEEILGLSIEEMKGRTCTDPAWDIIKRSGEPFPEEEYPIVVALRTGERVEDVVYGVVKPETAERVWLNVSAVPQFREGEEEPYQVFTTFLDITDLVETERELRKSEKKFRTLYETMAQGVLIQNKEGKITSANPAAAQILGLTQESLTGMSSLDVHWRTVRMNGEPLPGEEHPAMIALREGRRVEDFNMGLHEGDEFDTRWLSVSAVPQFREGQDEPYQVFTTFLDITDRIRIQHTLEERVKELRCISNISVAIQEDPSIPEICRSTVEELVRAMQHPELAKAVVELAGEHYEENGFSDGAENSLEVSIHLHGEQIGRIRVFYEEDIEFLIPQEKNLVESVGERLASYYDRLQTQQALQDSEERFRTGFMDAPVPIMIHAEDGEVVNINQTWSDISGYDLQEIPTVSDWVEKAYGHRKEPVQKVIQDLYQVEDQTDEGKFTINTKDGEERIWLFSSAPLGRTTDGRRTVISIARDITESERYYDRIMALQEIDQVISATLDLDEVVNRVTEEMRRVVHYDSMSVMLREKDHLKIFAIQGLNEIDALQELSFPIDPDYPIYKVITEKQTLALADVVEHYPKFNEPLFPEVSERVKSWLGVPLVSQDEVIGMFAIDRHEVNEFTEEDIEIAQQFANRAAIAIDNAQLYEKTRQQLEQLEILRKIDSLITTSLTLDEALPVLLHHIQDGLGVDAVAVLLFDEESKALTLESWLGLQEEPHTETSIALDQGNSGKIARMKESIFIPEVTYREDGADFPIIWDAEEVISFFGLPMLAKGELKGVLELFHRSRLDPDEDWINFAETLCGQAAITVDNITLFNDLQEANEDLRKAYDRTIEGWARALELRDQETEGHSKRVVGLSLRLAREFGFEEQDLPHIQRGVFLHDIGKMGIPDAILRKPGPLTEEEWVIMRRHPVFAFNMLKDIDYLEPALKIPHYHHERWDGSGYPEGLEGEEIPLEARIFMVVDIWDALRSDRPYRDAWSEEKTIKYLQEQAGKELDPEIVKVFLEIIQKDRE